MIETRHDQIGKAARNGDRFQTKPEIALAQIREPCEAGITRGVVLIDAGYGSDTRLRMSIGARGLNCIAGIIPKNFGLGIGHSLAAAEEMVGSWTTSEVDPS